MTIMPVPSPFIDENHRFVLDEAKFMEAITDLPAFIASPSPEYIAAAEIEPLLKILFHRNIS